MLIWHFCLHGEIEAACSAIRQSLPLLNDIGTKAAFQRLADTRALLQSAANAPSVQSLDEQIAVFLTVVS